MFKVLSESSISAGVRRIEALAGEAALRQYQEMVEAIERVKEVLKANEPELVEAVERLAHRERQLEKQVEQLRWKLAQARLGEQVRPVTPKTAGAGEVLVLSARVDLDRSQMRDLVDVLRNKLLPSGVIVLGSAQDGGKVALVVAVSKDLTTRLDAGKIAQAVARQVGGTGGGRPDLAEAGGKNAAELDGAIRQVYEIVAGML